MSLARLALRLAAYEALNPYATVATGPWPTIAGQEVFDSRIDLLQAGIELDAIVGKPVLIVYTEQDVTSPYGTAKYPADEQVVHLVIEAMIAAKGTVEVDDGNGTTTTYGTLEAPIADRQHEGLLDVLEAQVRRVLDRRIRAPSSGILDEVAMETHRVESVPQRAADRVTRLAARTITFTTKIKKDVWPTTAGTLPTPLAEVAARLDPASTGGLLCASVVAPQLQGLQPVPLVPLGSIVITTPTGSTDPASVPLKSSVPLIPQGSS